MRKNNFARFIRIFILLSRRIVAAKRINIVAKVYRLLASLKDETGTINPTRYRVARNGRTLIYDETLPSLLPLTIETTRGFFYVLTLASGKGYVLQPVEWHYFRQEVSRSPFASRLTGTTVWEKDTTILTIEENTHPLAYGEPFPGNYGQQEEIEFYPGGRHWEKHLQFLREERPKRRECRKKERLAKEIEAVFEEEGVLTVLDKLGFDRRTRFGISFKHQPKDNSYTITVLPAEIWATHVIPPTYLHCGNDRAMFLRAVSDFLASDYAPNLTQLACRQDETHGDSIYIEIRLRRERFHRNEVTVPLTDWLAEIEMFCSPTAKATHQAWLRHALLRRNPA